jgi:hypothetical protein
MVSDILICALIFLAIVGLLYGPIESYFFVADSAESGLNWCEAQYKLNMTELLHQRKNRDYTGAVCCSLLLV